MAVMISKPGYPKLKAVLVRMQGNTLRMPVKYAGFDLYDKLAADGIKCIVVARSLIPIESGNRVKTDMRDSYKLSCLKALYSKKYGADPAAAGRPATGW